MSSRDALILFLPEAAELPVRWMRVIDGALVQSGEGANWLAACGIAALPEQARVLLVPPAALVTLHWMAYPDLPPRDGRLRGWRCWRAGCCLPTSYSPLSMKMTIRPRRI